MDKSIRETVIFPLMKESANIADDKSKTGKAKETKIAVAIINKGAGLAAWQEMNTVAHLNAEFGVHQGKKLLLQDEITTKDGKQIKLNPQHAIIIKTAGSSAELLNLSLTAKEQGLEVSEFIREMIETTDDKKVIASVKEKNIEEIEYLGVLIFGKKSEVEALTKKLNLYS